MKILSKITMVLAFVCTLFILNPISAEAATGRILFNDPTVAAGEQFDITVKVMSHDSKINSISVDLKYDSSKIQFISGESSTGGDGNIKISATATGTEGVYILKFRALKQGETSITMESETVKTSAGDIFTIQEGDSVISVEGGTEVEASTEEPTVDEEIDDSVIQIAGIIYEISEGFIESEIPAGYTQEKMDIRGESISVVKGDTSGVILVYLVAPGETVVENEYGYTPKGRFFRYDEGTGKFSPYVQITVSDSTYIVFLTEDYEVEMPAQYIPTTMTADGFDFPAWQDTELDGYYLVYAISSNGDKWLYRYDVDDQSYQRFDVPPEPENPNKVSNETLQNIIDAIANNLLIVLSIIALIVLLLLILAITFGVKLRNRNREIEDIYEEGATAYSNSSFREVDDRTVGEKSSYDLEDIEDEWDDEFNYDFSGDIESSKSEGMIDDGLTQEFDITMGDDNFSDEGFVDYSNPVRRNNSHQAFNYDQYSGFKQSEFTQVNTNSNIGAYSKYQADDDDDIEFIEI